VFVGVRFGRIGREHGDERVECDGALRVGVEARIEGGGDPDGAAEFFADFAMEGGGGVFAGLDFAAGEFPFQREVFAGGALGDEDVVIAFEEDAADG
jgi:hypothetical protein